MISVERNLASRPRRRCRALTLACATGLALLTGCAGLAAGDGSPANANTGRRAEEVVAQRRPPPAPSNAPARSAIALREGIKLYDDGDFNGAIRRLASVDQPGETLANRLIALKYTAFSFCVTSRPGPCRQAFDKALRLDPSFDLGPGEHSHPLWGPVFDKAKKAS